jgi:hypothetical protein
MEAERCFDARAFVACAVMCGRTLEGICRHFKTQSSYLAQGLKELKERQLIDARLFDWSEALRAARNASAHATDETVSKEDARDLLDLVHAVCEYVFVLSSKFEAFMTRKSLKAAKPPKP